MSHKNLSYESKEPAFLQRLRAQAAGTYQERPLNRPKKQRNPEDDEDDEPVYVLEDNSTLSGKEFEALKDKTAQDAKAADGDKDEPEGKKASEGGKDDQKDAKARDSVLEVGAKAQKRKIGKIVGAEASDKEEEPKEKAEKKKSDETPKKKKPKSKGRVKLSFGDD
ncbi:hypothetical protein TWF694_002432 [Orbilia ellipsospora]|uniref:DUF4604 domain-containing protein n=1 Tax=Orbilia ellipsospora TaxID=2528407 RepID=A0AAV9X361_9PEZI